MKRAEYSGAFATAKGLKAAGLVAAGSRYVPVFLLNKQGITAAATVVVSRGSAWRRDTANDPRINICKRREAARCCDVAELIGLQPAEENKKTSSNVNESRWWCYYSDNTLINLNHSPFIYVIMPLYETSADGFTS